MAGRYPLDVFGPLLAGELRAGRTVVIDDVRSDPLTDTPTARHTYAAMQIVAMVVVPLLRDDRLMAVLVIAADRRDHGRGRRAPPRAGGGAHAVCG